MTRAIALQPMPEAAEFAPFGALVAPPAQHGDRRFYSDWLGGGDGLAPVFHVNSLPETVLPGAINTLERHPHAAQCFVPLDVTRYLVVVAPSSADGSPDLAGLRAFVVPGTRGVIYRQGVWHAGARVLDGPGAFAVLMWRGSANDDEFIDIPPVTLLAKDLSK
jgi:ureidoglycolate lyase